MNEDLLNRLSDVEISTSTPALHTIQRRAATMQRARYGRRISATALVGSAAAAALVLGPTLPVLGGGTPPSSAQAMEVMLEASAAAAEQPVAGEAAYWHVVTEYFQPDRSPDTQSREIWIGNNRPTVLIDTGVNVESGLEPGAAITIDSPGRWFLAGDWSGFADVPTDPDELERALRAEMEPYDNVEDRDQHMFETVRGMLTESPAPPLVRAALWEVLAGIPGITHIGPTTDSVGRPGVALAYNEFQLIVDPDTGALLETLFTSGPSEAAPDGQTYRGTLIEEGPADVAPVP